MKEIFFSVFNFYTSNEHQGITKRTVIIHKDPRGYGMRISGDNPVFIQHVNEGLNFCFLIP